MMGDLVGSKRKPGVHRAQGNTVMHCFVGLPCFSLASRSPLAITRHRVVAVSMAAATDANTILDLGRRTKRGTLATETERAEVEKLVSTLIDARKSDVSAAVDDVDAPVESQMLRGKWRLNYSTEVALVDLMRKGLPPLLEPALDVYQILDGGINEPGEIQNVVEFPRPSGVLNLVVNASFNSEPPNRCRFSFNNTELQFPGRTITLPFAIGAGYFDIIYFDERLRIDRDQRGWLNVYTYAGPSQKCTAYDSKSQ